MAHNWTTKTIADYPTGIFAVVTGDDTLGNGLKDTPYRSAVKAGSIAGTASIVLGTGGYTGSLFLGGHLVLSGEYLKGKQTVINLDGGTLTKSLYTSITFNDLTVKNGSVTLSCETGGGGIGTFNRVTFIDCIINNNSDALGGVYNYNDCEFINCTLAATFRMRPKYIRCKFFNTTSFNQKSLSVGWGCTLLESCYVDSFSKIEFNTEANVTEINFNDIEGQVKFQDGTNPDVYVGLAQALLDHPSEFGTKNINANPQFADVSKMAFVVGASSPLVGASKLGGNIGNAKRGVAYFCGISPELTPIGLGGTATFTNLVGTTDVTVDPAQEFGECLSGVYVNNSETVSVLGTIDYVGKYALDSSFGGLANSQVPDNFDEIDGTAGDNPDNLVYELRFSTGATPPTLPVHYDNGGLKTAGEYFTFVWNIQPRIDGAFLGNGDPAYNSASSFLVGCKWFQIRKKFIKSTWNNV